jgi:mannose-6-phosphate isomerase
VGLTVSTNLSPRKLATSHRERPWGVPMPGYGKVGECWYIAEPPLPILVKLLFTSEKLSVQVHPDGECGVGKTEMWHILDAAPGAQIALGFEQPIDANALRAAALSGEIERLLRWIPVSAGETYFIPAGTVHAIGAGITICEIQQNSDITYRLYDYGRPRELHLDLALEAADLGAWSHRGASPAQDLADGWRRLAGCRHFATDLRDVKGYFSYVANASSFELLIVLEGSGKLNGESFSPQDGWLLPSGAAIEIAPENTLRLLRTYLPSPDA